jgi:hypothetical protein
VRTITIWVPLETPTGSYNVNTVLFQGEEEIAEAAFDVEVKK